MGPCAHPRDSISAAGKVAFHAALGVYMLLVIRSRDKTLEEASEVEKEKEQREAERRGMLDQTEFENKAFRYVL